MKLPPENSDCTSDLSQWYHCAQNKGIPDEILSNAWNCTRNVSFVFHHRSATQEVTQEPVKKNSEKKKIIYEDDDFDPLSSGPEDANDEDYE